MSRMPAACCALALAALPVATIAQDKPPHIRPGLWQSDINMGAALSGMTMTMQMCMDESMEAQTRAFKPPTQGPSTNNCSQMSTKRGPDGFTSESTCTLRGRPTHTVVTVTGDFETAYKMDMTLTPDGGPEQKMSMTARRIGECPADLKPGQVTMSAKMDMNAIAAAAKARAAAGGQ